MSLPERVYETSLALARPLAGLLAVPSAKLRRGVAGRRRATASLERWAAEFRRPASPLLWVHAPSVGEALMAKAIIAAIRERRPDVQVYFTHFSPSAEWVAPSVGADGHGYLPWDVAGETRRALAALAPEAVVFVRTEIWPVLTREAAGRGVRLALVNAVLSEGSGRLRASGRLLLGAAYRRLDAIGAVASDDARRFSRLGVAPERVRVTGDARFDQVWARARPRAGSAAATGTTVASGDDDGRSIAAGADGNRRVLEALRADGVLTVVAGSTWPPDEARLLPAYARARAGASRPVRLIIAPHETDEAHLKGLERALDDAGLRHVRLARLESAAGESVRVRTGAPASHRASGGAESGHADRAGVPAPARARAPVPARAGTAEPAGEAIVVDRVGILADLYSLADVAYVGGGFHAAGLHSVVEPAAVGVPVLFGPRHGNAREAAALAEAGGGFEVGDPAAMARRLEELLAGDPTREAAGAAAESFVRSRLGGAEANADLVLGLLDR